MKKSEYLAQQDVKSFVDWFKTQISVNSNLGHTYTKPDGNIVEFSNLADALIKYDWPFHFVEPGGIQRHGKRYEENKAALTVLKQNLVAAILEGNDEKVKQWAIAAVGWGGVTAGNGQWFIDNVKGLTNELQRVAETLRINDDERSILPKNLRFNAGMTKIYSLLLKNFIIYDSRVAAALAWFVVMWLSEKNENVNGVPELLNFPCMPAKEGDNPKIRKLRNPSGGIYQFQKMHSRPSLHAQWNLRASWIIEAVIEGTKDTPFHQNGDSVRSVEAALFMWGYDLSQNSPWLTTPVAEDVEEAVEQEAAPDVILAADADADDAQLDWIGLGANTRGPQRLPFRWKYCEDADAILIRRDKGWREIFPVHETFGILHKLYDEFGEDWFHLRNNVIGLGNGAEGSGLGMTIMEIHPKPVGNYLAAAVKHGQASSYLGPVLEAIGLFQWNRQTRGIGWRLQQALPPTIEDLRDLLQGYVEEIIG